VFEDELRTVFAPAAASAVSGDSHLPGEIVGVARAVAPPGFVPVSYMAPAAPGQRALVRFSGVDRNATGEPVVIAVDPATLATTVNPPPDLLRRIFLLHANLMLRGRDGRQIVGWFGVAMLAMGVSGLVNWWPRLGGWRAAFRVSRRARGFRLWRALHSMAGIWGLLVFVTISCGGVYLAFPETVHGVVAAVLPARDLRAAVAAVKVQPVKGAEPLGLDDAVVLAAGRVADARLAFVFLPTRPDQPYRIALRRPGEDRRQTAVTVLVDPWARQVIETFDPREFSAGESLLAAQHPLHAGQGFGPVWKFLAFLAGLLPTLFAATGIAMWLKRRRQPRTATETPLIDQAYTARRAGE
jgi:uncharacterized iron-regulated membrane protein